MARVVYWSSQGKGFGVKGVVAGGIAALATAAIFAGGAYMRPRLEKAIKRARNNWSRAG